MVRYFVLFSLFASSVSQAAPAKPISYQAVIRAQLAPLASERFEGADLYMDGRAGQIDLTLHKAGEESQTITLEGARSVVDECGVIITSKEEDMRPVDGAYTKIAIRHNQNNTCPTFRPLKAIEVNFVQAYYNRFKGEEVRTEDSFESDDVAFINPGNKGDVEFQGTVNSLSYDNKMLTLNLSYSGGCKTHAFDLKWGECKKVKLLSSVIDQCEFTVLHTEGADDSCKAFVTKDHQIDLSGLAQAYIVKIGSQKVLVH